MSALVSPADPRLRPMDLDDLKDVLEVEQAAYEFPWTRGIFRDCIRVGYSCFVYQGPTRPIGHGIMSIGAGECHVLNVCIHPDYQRCGYGRSMIDFLLNEARKREARIALLEVRLSNVDAYRLYIRMGFNEVGIRKDYYPARHGREDAVVLARDLTIDT